MFVSVRLSNGSQDALHRRERLFRSAQPANPLQSAARSRDLKGAFVRATSCRALHAANCCVVNSVAVTLRRISRANDVFSSIRSRKRSSDMRAGNVVASAVRFMPADRTGERATHRYDFVRCAAHGNEIQPAFNEASCRMPPRKKTTAIELTSSTNGTNAAAV